MFSIISKDHIPIFWFLLIILIYADSACTSTQKKSAKGEVILPEVAKPDRVYNVAFVLVDGVYNSELVAPMDIFHHTVFHTDPGMKVFTVAPEMDTITTFEGLRLIPDFHFGSTDLPEIDILVVPSAENSMGSDLDNQKLIGFVQVTGGKCQFIMSLCDGAFVLARAGLAQGHESTTFPSDIPAYREMFPELTVHEGVSFVHDQNLVTSAGGAKSYDAALYLVELLYGNEVARGVARGLVIDWDLGAIKHVIVQ